MINQYLNNIVNQSTLYAPNTGAEGGNGLSGGLNEMAIQASYDGEVARHLAASAETDSRQFTPLDDGLTPDELAPRRPPPSPTPNL